MPKPSPYIIIITDRQVLPPWGGNSFRILELIQSLRVSGWRVALICAEVGANYQLKAEVEHLVVIKAPIYLGGELDAFDVEPFRRALEKLASKLRPAIVIAEYVWLAPAMRSLQDGIARWVDCHDLLHERTARFRTFGIDPWVVCSKVQESEYLSCADGLIAIQNQDAVFLKKLCPSKRVVSLLPSLDLPRHFKRIRHKTSKVLMVGARHAGNQGIVRFTRRQWPGVLARVPEAQLHIVGAIGEEIPPIRGVNLVGEVTNLFPFYNSAAVVLCPIIVGTGVKIKMIEALRLGKAVVATHVASEGLPPSRTCAWLKCETLTECADLVASLLKDVKMRLQLEDSAYAYGKKYLSRKRFLTDLRSILPPL